MTTFELTGTGGISGRVTVTEQVLEEENRSVLTCNLELTSHSWYGVTYWLQGNALGRAFSSNEDSVYIEKRGQYEALEPWSISVPHNADGSGTVNLTLSLSGYTASGSSGSGWHLEGSRTVTLTPIARASDLQVTDGDIGQTVQVSILRKKDSYTHKLQYQFGGISGEIDPKNETKLSFLLPEEFYYEIPNSPTGLCRMVCTTYDGERQVGAPAEAVFTVRAANCAPLLEAKVADVCEDTLESTEDPGTLVRFVSHAHCTAAAEGQKGAQILSVTVNGVPVPTTFEKVEGGSFLFRATDSRGYVTEKTVTLPLVPYIPPTVNGWCSRPDGNGNAVLTLRGNCFRGMIGTWDNTPILKVDTGDRYELILEPDKFEGDSYSAVCTLEGLDYKTAHTIRIQILDGFGRGETVIDLPPGKPVFDWGSRDFAFHVPVTAPRINGIKNPALKAWPVGAIMFTEGLSPASIVGGKWELYDVPGLPVIGWRRVQGADMLGSALLGQMLLGTEE